jgi:hypothetical protein
VRTHTHTHIIAIIIIIIIIIIISLISVESEHAIGTAELNTIAKYNSEFVFDTKIAGYCIFLPLERTIFLSMASCIQIRKGIL